MKEHIKYTVAGLMSGTSVDGLDICISEFWKQDDRWQYKILIAFTKAYPFELKEKLVNVSKMSAEEVIVIEQEFSKFISENINSILHEYGLKIDFIASHGHTVFHNPKQFYTYQIGNGEQIAKTTGIPVVCDFRRGDVALGGQGAPLVPIGDLHLFSKYKACLNLGGFSNISYQSNTGKRIAYDISPLNILLNKYSRMKGEEYDEFGKMAESGEIIPDLLNQLNSLNYYKLLPPKSLAIEWVNQQVVPILEKYEDLKVEDILCTLTNNMAGIISQNLDSHSNVLITGGGAYNKYLISLIRKSTTCELVIPDELTIDFKEALVFAFLGVLRWCDEINILASVTGASRNSSGGIVCFP
ncbi:MAG: anhydro-N-acetylmuramic acid kinase [Marinilabiliales bacterium]|nr:MAG: anhydro-N-acetylmuramic acid kinase [Marinilabiliales bacterium]